MSHRPVSRRTLVKGAAAALPAAAVVPSSNAWAGPSQLTVITKARRQETNEVRAWFFGGLPGEDDWRQPRIEQFQEETGITVTAEIRPWENQRQDLLAALTGGDVPDLIRVHHKYVGEFGDTGDLQAFNELEGWDEYAQQFVPSYLEALTHNGTPYGVPIYVFPFILAANQTMLDSAGVTVPTNWDEFTSAATTIAQPDQGIYGYTIPGGVNLDTAYRFVPWLYKAGGRVLNDDWSEPTFNSEAGVAALEMLVELQQAGAIPSGNAAYAFQENADLWGAQKAAMSTEGPWWQGVMTEQYNLDTGMLTVAPVPAPAAPIGQAAPGTLVDVIMMTLMTGGRNVEGGWQLLQYLINAEEDQRFVEEEGTGLPVTTAAYGDEATWSVIGRETYATESESAIVWPNHPSISEIQMLIAEACNAAFSGGMGAQEALDQAAEDAMEILAD